MANVLVERQSLVNAADAIREKLGTQELITPEDFGEKIGEISGGGENIPRTQWGAVKMYPGLIANFDIRFQSGCTVVVKDANLFLSFCEENDLLNEPDIMIEYNSGNWQFGWGGASVSEADLLSTTGLQITRTSSSAMAELEYAPSPSGDPIWVNLLSASEYETIRADYDGNITVGGESVSSRQVVAFAFGTENTSTNENMFAEYLNIEKIYFDNADKLTTLSNGFCINCHKLNSPISCDTVTTIGENVFSSCESFCSPINLPNAYSIGGGFMNGCSSFHSDKDLTLDFSHMTSIPSSFLNGTIITSLSFLTTDGQTMYSSVTSIGNYVFSGVSLGAFHLKSNTLTSIGDDFLRGAMTNSNTDNILNFPNLTTVGTDFLRGVYCYGNLEITAPKLKSVGAGFLRDGDFTLGENPSSVSYTFSLPMLTTVGNSFMYNCAGRTTVTLSTPSLTNLGGSFLAHCKTRIASYTIPETARGYLNWFAYDADIERIVCNAPYSNFSYSGGSNPQQVFATGNNRNAAYLLGITISGPNRGEFLTALPNSDTAYLRKLIDGGA